MVGSSSPADILQILLVVVDGQVFVDGEKVSLLEHRDRLSPVHQVHRVQAVMGGLLRPQAQALSSPFLFAAGCPWSRRGKKEMKRTKWGEIKRVYSRKGSSVTVLVKRNDDFFMATPSRTSRLREHSRAAVRSQSAVSHYVSRCEPRTSYLHRTRSCSLLPLIDCALAADPRCGPRVHSCSLRA